MVKPIRHFYPLIIQELSASVVAYMVITSVVAIVLSLLNNTDSSDCLPTLAGLLKSYLLNGTQGDTCSFAEFNNHSIKGTLHYVCRGRYGYDYVKHIVYSIGISIYTIIYLY